MAEMAFRPYDPCHGCGTHAWPGGLPLTINIYDRSGETDPAAAQIMRNGPDSLL